MPGEEIARSPGRQEFLAGENMTSKFALVLGNGRYNSSDAFPNIDYAPPDAAQSLAS